jgi:hypothetical protein
MANYTITLTDADAAELDGDQNKKVCWTNNSGSEISLNPPAGVTPNQTTVIANGATSRDFQITGQKGLTYDYTFMVGAEVGTRNGKIRVNT